MSLSFPPFHFYQPHYRHYTSSQGLLPSLILPLSLSCRRSYTLMLFVVGKYCLPSLPLPFILPLTHLIIIMYILIFIYVIWYCLSLPRPPSFTSSLSVIVFISIYSLFCTPGHHYIGLHFNCPLSQSVLSLPLSLTFSQL